MKKKVLVYPCGTEIGLEIFRSVKFSKHFELIGGSSSYDHGRFVYSNHIDNLPFISDNSSIDVIIKFNDALKSFNIDYIYPAMDGVIFSLSKFRHLLSPTLISSNMKTTNITRSKSKTYKLLEGIILVPEIYNFDSENLKFPLFVKPDIGQGSQNAIILRDLQDLNIFKQKNDVTKFLLLEYLPGNEYTIDCFTNSFGKLVYVSGRNRNRIRSGISVNCTEENNPLFAEIAQRINSTLEQKGGWFFQVKVNRFGEFCLLEVASRIAGTSAFTRNIGINLPLLTLHLFNGDVIDQVFNNNYKLELDRAFYNKFKIDLKFDSLYIDYDDTIIVNNKINLEVISFLFQCINGSIPITLLTKHEGDIHKELINKRIFHLFDKIIHIHKNDEKYNYIKSKKAIFIDDSYVERLKVHENTGINVFDTHMIECLFY